MQNSIKKPERLPFITIAILTKNAKKDIEVILQKLREIDYPKNRIETILVDNGSIDGTHKMVERKFKNVNIIFLDKNYGMSALNNAFKIAKGKYLMVFDDDSYIEKSGLKKLAKEFSNDALLGILACNILNPYDNSPESKYMPKTGKSIKWRDFTGGGVAIKTEIFNKIGYFSEDILIYGHEADFAIRALNNGIGIKLAPSIHVYRIGKANVMNATRMKLGIRNFLGIFWRYTSIPLALSATCGILIEYAILALMYRLPVAYFEGLGLFIKNIPFVIKNRNPINKSVEKAWSKDYPLTMRNFYRRMTRTYYI